MNRFKITTIIVLFALVFASLGITFVAELQQLSLSVSEFGHSADGYYRLEITSSQALELESLRDAISFSPEVNWELTQVKSDRFELNLSEHLEQDLIYKLSISTSLKDVYGKQLLNEYTFEIQPEPIRFAYVEKGPIDKSGRDQIMLVKLGEEPRSLGLFRDIQLMATGRNEIAVVNSNAKGAHELSILRPDLAIELVTKLELGTVNITKLEFSPTGDKLLFAMQEVNLNSGVAVPLGSTDVHIYDIASNSFYRPDIRDQAGDVLDAKFTPDGKGILIHSDVGEYVLFDLSNVQDFLLMGKHIDSAGFSPDSNTIIWTDVPLSGPYSGTMEVNMMDTNRDTKSLISNAGSIVDISYISSNQIIYAQQYAELAGTRGLYQIKSLDLTTMQDQVLVRQKGRSLELPKSNITGRYLLVEEYKPSDLLNYERLRSFGFQAKPYSGRVILYDLETGDQTIISDHATFADWLK